MNPIRPEESNATPPAKPEETTEVRTRPEE